MSRNELEDLIEELYIGVWDFQDMDVADEHVHQEYYIHDRDIAEELQGPELYKALAKSTLELFPDASFRIDDMLSTNDRVALRWTMTGTHEKELFGVEPTGEKIRLPAIEINRFEEKKLIETWTQSDLLGLMEQLGLQPVPGDSETE